MVGLKPVTHLTLKQGGPSTPHFQFLRHLQEGYQCFQNRKFELAAWSWPVSARGRPVSLWKLAGKGQCSSRKFQNVLNTGLSSAHTAALSRPTASRAFILEERVTPTPLLIEHQTLRRVSEANPPPQPQQQSIGGGLRGSDGKCNFAVHAKQPGPLHLTRPGMAWGNIQALMVSHPSGCPHGLQALNTGGSDSALQEDTDESHQPPTPCLPPRLLTDQESQSKCQLTVSA